MRILGILLCVFIFLTSCQHRDQSKLVFESRDLYHLNTRLLQVAMRDNFNPPQASRVYVYPHIANYMVLQAAFPDSLGDFAGKLNQLEPIPKAEAYGAEPTLAGLLAFCHIGKKVVFSEHYMESIIDSLLESARGKGYSESIIKKTTKYAIDVSGQLIEWINQDNYIQTRTYDRFTSSVKPWEWRETPPDYISALEPNWPKIRTLIIPSADFYKAPPPPEYSSDKNSDFYKMVYEVFEGSTLMDEDKELVAWFWDDNPNITVHTGHLMTMIHKYAPPGHWLNITTQVCEKEGCSLTRAARTYTLSAIAMFDGIISCWHEKYTTNLVRPITYINEYIDPFWRSLIQTPPFPEYTSGHSVLSAAAAEVLTQEFGENYTFTDNTQLLFEMEERTFTSFHDAAWEVSLSRFYGGIHYMNGIREGNVQGKYVGEYVLDKLIK